MAQNALTAGVKPGGLTDTTQIRILLCYLLHSVPEPMTRDEIEQALLDNELVNYFELADALGDVCERHLAEEKDGHYRLLTRGAEVAATLGDDVPRSVRDTAVRAAVAAQQLVRKAALHKVRRTPCGEGFTVHCSIEDAGGEAFSCALYLPDAQSAAFVERSFVENGDRVYKLVLAALTGNDDWARRVLSEPKL